MLFVDTSYLVGLAQASDSAHRAAHRLRERFESELVCTSELVLGEMWTLLRRRMGQFHAVSWVDRVRAAPAIRVEQIDEDVVADAWAWLRLHDERPYSFVDATSFVLMRRLRIIDVLAFDDGFEAAGFTVARL